MPVIGPGPLCILRDATSSAWEGHKASAVLRGGGDRECGIFLRPLFYISIYLFSFI